jgi:4-hydroxy-tetrahydrodipicolinate synthase
MAAANAGDKNGASAADAPLSALHRDLFCEANPIPVKWALSKMGKMEPGIRLPLSTLGADFHGRVTAALQQAHCIEGSQDVGSGSFGWPSKDLLLQGHLFDQQLINQALDIIEKQGGDFEVINFSVQPNDQNSEFNFKRTSSVHIKVLAVDGPALDDIVGRLHSLVEVLESAEGSLTELPAAAAAAA